MTLFGVSRGERHDPGSSRQRLQDEKFGDGGLDRCAFPGAGVAFRVNA
jgi:hypothetical protein